MRTAAAEKASANSEALKATTDSPAAFFTSNRVELRGALARLKVNLQRPFDRIVFMLNHAGEVTNLSRAAGGGHDVKIRRQRDVTRGHIKQPFFRRACHRLRFADDDRVSSPPANARSRP